MSDKAQELLLELLLLRKRYSDHDFQSVLSIIESVPQEEVLIAILSLLSRLESSTKNNEVKRQKKTSPLETLKEVSPGQYTLLKDFKSRLLNREALPEAKDLRELLEEIGIKYVSGNRREQNIKLIIDNLSNVPFERVQKIIDNISSSTKSPSDNDFGILADAILKRNL